MGLPYYLHPDSAIIAGFIVCVLGALWGWYFLFSCIEEIPKDERKVNPHGFAFRVFVAIVIYLLSHLPLAIYTVVLYEYGYMDKWK